MRNNYRNRKLTLRRKGGGILDSLKQTFSDLGSKISQTANSAWNQTKRATGMTDSTSSTSPTSTSSMTYSTSPTSTSSTSYSSSPSSSLPSSSSSSSSSSSQSQPYGSYGGRRKRMKKTKLSNKMRGGQYEDNISLTNIASKAAPFSGVTARPHTMVGGPVRMLGGAKSKKHRIKKRLRVKSKKYQK